MRKDGRITLQGLEGVAHNDGRKAAGCWQHTRNVTRIEVGNAAMRRVSRPETTYCSMA